MAAVRRISMVLESRRSLSHYDRSASDNHLFSAGTYSELQYDAAAVAPNARIPLGPTNPFTPRECLGFVFG